MGGMERPAILVWLAILSAAPTACAGGGAGESKERAGEGVSRSIEEVQEAHTPEWMEIPGVVGTGIGLCDEEPCIKVFVARRTEEIEREVPEKVEGYRVRIEVTGEFRALDTTGG